MKTETNPRLQEMADATLSFVHDTMVSMHRGAFNIEPTIVAIFGNDGFSTKKVSNEIDYIMNELGEDIMAEAHDESSWVLLVTAL
jgi:hypothetical protein